MSRRAHLLIRVAALAVLVVASLTPRGGPVAKRDVASPAHKSALQATVAQR